MGLRIRGKKFIILMWLICNFCREIQQEWRNSGSLWETVLKLSGGDAKPISIIGINRKETGYEGKFEKIL